MRKDTKITGTGVKIGDIVKHEGYSFKVTKVFKKHYYGQKLDAYETVAERVKPLATLGQVKDAANTPALTPGSRMFSQGGMYVYNGKDWLPISTWDESPDRGNTFKALLIGFGIIVTLILAFA